MTCFKHGCPSIFRIGLLDNCGNPVAGPLNGFAGNGIIEISWNPIIEEGEETTIKTICGDICRTQKLCDQIKGHDISMKLCNKNMDLKALIEGLAVGVDGAGDTNAYTVGYGADNCQPYVSLEIWQKESDEECSGVAPGYVRIILPRVRLREGDTEFQGPLQVMNVTGRGFNAAHSLWGVGGGTFNDMTVAVPQKVGDTSFWEAAVIEPTLPTTLTTGAAATAIAECKPFVVPV